MAIVQMAKKKLTAILFLGVLCGERSPSWRHHPLALIVHIPLLAGVRLRWNALDICMCYVSDLRLPPSRLECLAFFHLLDFCCDEMHPVPAVHNPLPSYIAQKQSVAIMWESQPQQCLCWVVRAMGCLQHIYLQPPRRAAHDHCTARSCVFKHSTQKRTTLKGHRSQKGR